MVQLDDFKQFDFRHLTTAEFFEVERLVAELLLERDALIKENTALRIK